MAPKQSQDSNPGSMTSELIPLGYSEYDIDNEYDIEYETVNENEYEYEYGYVNGYVRDNGKETAQPFPHAPAPARNKNNIENY